MGNTLIWWVILFVLSILFELSSPGLFFFLALSVGAGAAALITPLGFSAITEFMVFALVSTGSFLLLVRYVKAASRDTLHSTNVYALVGKKGIVTESLSDCKKGWVKVEGELWAALPADTGIIEKGAVVEVLRSSGSHLVVKKIEGIHC